MSSRALVAKIDALPPEKLAEVEEFVDRLAADGAAGTADVHGLVARIEARRERLRRERGMFSDSVPLIREFRENGE